VTINDQGHDSLMLRQFEKRARYEVAVNRPSVVVVVVGK